MAELKRREEGRGLGESKKSLEDLRRQSWISERKKAKEEEKAAREAVSVHTARPLFSLLTYAAAYRELLREYRAPTFIHTQWERNILLRCALNGSCSYYVPVVMFLHNG